MKRRNALHTLIASFLLMLVASTLLVKPVHCVLISHDPYVAAVLNEHVAVSNDQTDDCPICSFDFFPVILHSLQVLPNAIPFTFSEYCGYSVDAPVKQASHLFLLRAPPSI